MKLGRPSKRDIEARQAGRGMAGVTDPNVRASSMNGFPALLGLLPGLIVSRNNLIEQVRSVEEQLGMADSLNHMLVLRERDYWPYAEMDAPRRPAPAPDHQTDTSPQSTATFPATSPALASASPSASTIPAHPSKQIEAPKFHQRGRFRKLDLDSDDIRRRREEGQKWSHIARDLGVSEPTVQRWALKRASKAGKRVSGTSHRMMELERALKAGNSSARSGAKSSARSATHTQPTTPTQPAASNSKIPVGLTESGYLASGFWAGMIPKLTKILGTTSPLEFTNYLNAHYRGYKFNRQSVTAAINYYRMKARRSKSANTKSANTKSTSRSASKSTSHLPKGVIQRRNGVVVSKKGEEQRLAGYRAWQKRVNKEKKQKQVERQAKAQHKAQAKAQAKTQSPQAAGNGGGGKQQEGFEQHEQQLVQQSSQQSSQQESAAS